MNWKGIVILSLLQTLFLQVTGIGQFNVLAMLLFCLSLNCLIWSEK